MDEALTLLYRDILEFHRRALPIFRFRTWRQVFGSIWKNFNTRFEHILQDLRRHKQLIESQAAALHFSQYHADRQIIGAKLQHLEDAESDRRYLELLQWLRPVKSPSDHEDIIEVCQDFPSCGEWFFKNSNYSTWRTDDVPRSPILWLRGIPGAGKTVLASRIIEHCQQDHGARIVFFYCKDGDPERTTAIAILRTLLSQALSREHDLLPWCYDVLLGSGQPTLSSRRLCGDMLEAVLLDGTKKFMIIDGIDECPRSERTILLNLLHGLITTCESKEPGLLRLLVVSQDEPDVRTSLRNAAEIVLGMDDNRGDVRAFVQWWCKRLQQNFRIADDEVAYILESTCHRTEGRKLNHGPPSARPTLTELFQGMFLFAKLIMINLNGQKCLADLREQTLPENFPAGLGDA